MISAREPTINVHLIPGKISEFNGVGGRGESLSISNCVFVQAIIVACKKKRMLFGNQIESPERSLSAHVHATVVDFR